MPVLPLDGSRMVWPGRRVPSASAASTMALAMRSFTDPVGFWPSSLARMRTAGLGLSSVSSTSGVLPIRSRTDRWTATVAPSAPGDGRQDRDHVVVGDLGVELLEIPHVVVVAVHVDELVDAPVVGDHLTLEQGELTQEVLEDLADRAAVGPHRGLAAGVLAQDGRKTHL